ncbi:DUF2304 domain-containing protein [Gulosibacter bifidus]|uniref:DUF2304 domain-containing protein n=1 Tax=Gulosibacter bifidus TaxID=272239 RepID=A0ABW5RIP7_9MICO|nr:DUF2304 domain-containing protein [Gulosibacter bifidus]
MDTQQIIIKSILIVVLAVAALVLIFPGRGARGQAIRRLAILLGLVVGIVAVIFPHLAQAAADFLGIGRGTDLLFYLCIIFFIAYVVSASSHARRTDRTLTVLARKLALLEAELRKTGALRYESTVASGNETVFTPPVGRAPAESDTDLQ